MNLIQKSMAACAFVLGLLFVGATHAQTKQSAMNATGRDFEAQSVKRLGSMNADFLCERLFDSADTVGMMTELVRIAGPAVMMGEFLKFSGQSDEALKDQFEQLRTLARQKVWLPVAAERKVGEWMDRKYRREGLVVEATSLPPRQRARYDMVKKLLDGIVATLPADSPYQFQLAVSPQDVTNASASPGGFIYVTAGMLQDKTLDRNDLALRLTHEVSHVTRRHALKDLQVKVVDALAISKRLKPLLNFAQDPVGVLDALLGNVDATELLFQRFGQVQELEADACGTYLLVKQDVDAPKAVKRFVKARGGNKQTGWEASHPAAEERELVMTAQVDPATRARVSELRVGAAPPAVTGATKSGGNSNRSQRSAEGTTTESVPAGNALQPTREENSVSSFFERLKNRLPTPDPAAQTPPPIPAN